MAPREREKGFCEELKREVGLGIYRHQKGPVKDRFYLGNK